MTTGESRPRRWLQKVVQEERAGGTEALRDGQPQTTVQSLWLSNSFSCVCSCDWPWPCHLLLTGAAADSRSAGGEYGRQDRAAGPSPAQRETYGETQAPPAETRPWAPGEHQEESPAPGGRTGGRRPVWVWWWGSGIQQEEKRWCWTDCGHTGAENLSPSCCSRHVYFLWNIKNKLFWRMLVTKQFWFSLTSIE